MKKDINSMTLAERQEVPIRELLEDLHQRLCGLECRQQMTSESVSSDNKWLARTDDRVKLLIAQMEMISQVFGAIQEATTHTETAKKLLSTEGKSWSRDR
jgi:hypothetical protein